MTRDLPRIGTPGHGNAGFQLVGRKSGLTWAIVYAKNWYEALELYAEHQGHDCWTDCMYRCHVERYPVLMDDGIHILC